MVVQRDDFDIGGCMIVLHFTAGVNAGELHKAKYMGIDFDFVMECTGGSWGGPPQSFGIRRFHLGILLKVISSVHIQESR